MDVGSRATHISMDGRYQDNAGAIIEEQLPIDPSAHFYTSPFYKPPLNLYGYDLLPLIKLEDDILRGETCL